MCDAVKEYGNEREAFGKEIGKAEATAEERKTTAKTLLAMGNLSIEDIAKASRLTVEEVEALADM